MENRFGFKDVLLIGLLGAILVSLWLKMAQDDRQWDLLQGIGKKLDQQTSDLAGLRRMIGEGGAAMPGVKAEPAPGGAAVQDVHRRVRLVRQRPDFAYGDTFIESFLSPPPKLNYLTSHDTYSRIVYSRILEGLAEWDLELLQMVPALATGWKWSADQLSLEVELRRNVSFSDGVGMTSADVAHTWSLVQNPNITDGQVRAYYAPIKKVEATGEYTVRFEFQKVFYENFMRAMEVPVLPKHFMSRFTERQIRESPALVMGTGPYRLADPEKYTPGEPIEVRRNERYWGVPGPWDRIIWRVIEKEAADMVAFGNGEIDAFVPTPEQHVKMAQDQALKARTQHFIYDSFKTGYYFIGWNQQKGGKDTIFADKRVRQAMTMLLDRERMCQEIFLGFASVADGPFYAGSPQQNPDVRPWPYDPKRAIELLAEAGLKRDDKGRMRDRDGSPLAITLSYPSSSELIKKVSLFLKDNLAQAGIELKLDPQEWGLLLKNMLERNFEASMSGWGGGSIEGDIEQMFHTRNIKEGDNRTGYSNPELDKLIEQAHVTLDEAARMKLWQQCHAILHEDQPYTFMNRSRVRLWLDKRIANVTPMPVFGVNYNGMWPVPLEWYVPKGLQKRVAQ
jgi:peptide/nickel transport system substrate-binding protein